MNRNGDQHSKLVEWSEEDRCYIGSAPPLIGHCCHGDDPVEVQQQLDVIIAEWLAEGLPAGSME